MNIKSQISIFIVIGVIVILGGIFLASVMSDSKIGVSSNKVQSNIQLNAKDHMDFCVNNLLKDSVFNLGLQGGYYNLGSIDSVQYLSYNVPYYWNGTEEFLPDEIILSEQLKSLIEDYFYLCLVEINLNQNIVNVSYSVLNQPTSDLTIRDYDIIGDLNFPITFDYLEEKQSFDSFPVQYFFNYNEKLKIIDQIIEFHKEDPYFIPLSKLNNLAYENNFSYELTELEDNDVLYTLVFNDPISNEKYTHSFVIKYLELEELENEKEN